MLEFEYARSYACPAVREITIIRESYWWEPRKLPQLTEAELATVPESFRCYVCGSVHRKKDFGGYLVKQRICSRCYPWVDDSHIGYIIRWDEKHGYARFIREV